MKRFFFLFGLLPLTLNAFEQEPWLHDVMEFQFIPSYTFQHYPDVQGGFNPKKYSSNNHIASAILGLSFHPQFDVQFEAEFNATKKLSFGWMSAGAQLRYLILNDTAGDAFSWYIGVNGIFTDLKRLRDVGTPYHFVSNVEIGTAIGKEFSRVHDWVHRLWAYVAIGQANRGDPWVRALFNYWYNIADTHRFHFFVWSYFGLGSKNRINIATHQGYAKVAHRSIDTGLAYQYHFKIWGDLTLRYFYRPYAHAFPKHLQSITLEYRLPFSLL